MEIGSADDYLKKFSKRDEEGDSKVETGGGGVEEKIVLRWERLEHVFFSFFTVYEGYSRQ